MTTTPAPSISVSPLSGTATGPFPTGWKYGAAEDVRVYLELAGVRGAELTQGSDYTVTGATPLVDGGTVTLSASVVPPGGWDEEAGDRVVIFRRTVKRQGLALPDAEGHKPRQTEQALDKLTRAAEEAGDGLSRAVQVRPGETPPQLPPQAERQAGLITWAAGGLRRFDITPGHFVAGDAQGRPVSASGAGADAALRTDLAAAAGSALVGFQRRPLVYGGVTNLTRKQAAYAIDAQAEGYLTHSGLDESLGWAALLAEALKSGKEIHVDGSFDDIEDVERPVLTIAQAVPFRVKNALDYASAFRPGLVVRGVGRGYTRFHFTGEDGYLFDITVGDPDGDEYGFADFAGVLGGGLYGLSVTGDRAKARSGFVRFRSAYQFEVGQFHVKDLSGHGVFIDCQLGDTDGSNQLTLRDGRMENGGFNHGFAIQSAAVSGHNEISGLSTDNVFIQSYGRNECPAIVGLSQTNPIVATLDDDAHLPASGDKIYIVGLGGMTSIDTDVAETGYTLASFDPETRTGNLRNLANTANIDGTALPAYTGGGRMIPVDPKSGALSQKGQICRHSRLFLTLNLNVSIYEKGEAGAGQDADYVSSTIENPHGIGFLCTGWRRSGGPGIHAYSNAGFIPHNFNRYAHLIDATRFTVSHRDFRDLVVRTTAAETNYTVVRAFGGNLDHQTLDYGQPVLKQSGYAGQKLMVGLRPPIPAGRFRCELVAATVFRVRPGNGGNSLPVQLSLTLPGGGVKTDTGEVIGYRMGSTGIVKTPTYPPYAGAWGAANAPLLPDTQYWGYSADASTYLGRPDIEWWPTAPTEDGPSGGLVLPGDVTRRFVWSVVTDATGQFRLTAIDWANPEFRHGFWFWVDATGALRKKATRPTLAGGGDLDGTVV